MNINDEYWGNRITVRQDLVGGWILGRDPSNTYTAKRFLLFKPDGKCCTMLTISESDAMLLHASIRAAEATARAEGCKAGQEAMRKRASVYYATKAPRLKGKGEDGYKMVDRDLVLLPSEQAMADAIAAISIEEPAAS